MMNGKIFALFTSSILFLNAVPITSAFDSSLETTSNAKVEKLPSSAVSSDPLNTDILNDEEIDSLEKINDEIKEIAESTEGEETKDTQEIESHEAKENLEKATLENFEGQLQKKSSIEEDTLDKEAEESKTYADETDASILEVSTWKEFVDGVRNETITKIVVLNSFENPSSSDANLSLYTRKNNLEIDGQGNRIDFKNSSIYLGSPSNTIGYFHMHDIVLNQRYGGAYSEDIVGARLNTTNGAKWKYRFGNITTEPGVQRLARASYSEVTVYGEMDIDTRAENFYLGSLIMEDNTHYQGNVNYYDFSIFWYNVAASNTSTGASKEFTIGKNCRVDLTQSQSTGTTFPAVYSYYQAFTVGEKSVLNINMPGNAVRFDMDGAGMRIKSEAVVNLTSKKNSGSVVAFSNDNNYLIVEPDAYFYTIGLSSQPLINLAANGLGTASVARKNNTFVLNKPAQYDIRNLRDGYTAVQVDYFNNNNNSFEIINSDIDLWENKTPALGPSDETYTQVSSFVVAGNGTRETITTTTPELMNFSQKNYRRISGMNQNPVLEWVPVTDADKTKKVRVIIGYVPDNNGLNTDGEIAYIPVYASENQAVVTYTNSYGEVIKDNYTDKDGYANIVSDTFELAGETLKATAQRGPWSTEEVSTYQVIDVTPPQPAEVEGGNKQSSFITKLSGKGETNANVSITLNGSLIEDIHTKVDSEGNWELSLVGLELKKDDILQVFLQDTSGKITEISDLPTTNNEIGNIQPAERYSYRDAVFEPATKIIIIGTLSLVSVPQTFDFGSQTVSNVTKEYHPIVEGDLVVSDDRGDEKQAWRLLLRESQAMSTGSYDLSGLVYYQNSTEKLSIGEEAQIVEQRQLDSDGELNISDEWVGNKGISLEIPVEKQRIGNYTGTLSWSVEDVPIN